MGVVHYYLIFLKVYDPAGYSPATLSIADFGSVSISKVFAMYGTGSYFRSRQLSTLQVIHFALSNITIPHENLRMTPSHDGISPREPERIS